MPLPRRPGGAIFLEKVLTFEIRAIRTEPRQLAYAVRQFRVEPVRCHGAVKEAISTVVTVEQGNAPVDDVGLKIRFMAPTFRLFSEPGEQIIRGLGQHPETAAPRAYGRVVEQVLA